MRQELGIETETNQATSRNQEENCLVVNAIRANNTLLGGLNLGHTRLNLERQNSTVSMLFDQVRTGNAANFGISNRN